MGFKPGKVRIEKGKYKIDGDFHKVEPNTPIYNMKGRLKGITNPRDMTYMHAYGGESIFFESLSKGKLMASRCDNDDCENKGSIYMPFRIHCPDCLAKNTSVDITEKAKNSAKVHTFMITERTGAFNTLPTPIKFINVEFEDVVTILMGYLSVGEPEIGMKVVPIFKKTDPTYTILDLSWVPKGTDESELPLGYEFE